MWYNPIVKLILRSPLHGLVDSGILLLSYEGRKSGKLYSIPVSYICDGDEYLVVTFKTRRWWQNLKTIYPVRIRLRGKDIPATGRAIFADPQAVAADLAIYLEHQPQLLKYFNVERDADGSLNQEQVRQAAEKRVMVRLKPIQ